MVVVRQHFHEVAVLSPRQVLRLQSSAAVVSMTVLNLMIVSVVSVGLPVAAVVVLAVWVFLTPLQPRLCLL